MNWVIKCSTVIGKLLDNFSSKDVSGERNNQIACLQHSMSISLWMKRERVCDEPQELLTIQHVWNKTKSKCNNNPNIFSLFQLAWAVANRSWCSFISFQCCFFCAFSLLPTAVLNWRMFGTVYTWCVATLNYEENNGFFSP